MKTKLIYLLIAITFAMGNLKADDRVRVRATDSDISDNLDLAAVASLFGESDNLTDFERRLNDPEYEISNLDLNEDGYVDYLRVIEIKTNGVFLITIQAVLGEDIFQDVATIEIDRDDNRNYAVYIIGNDFLFGSNYIIVPEYHRIPTIFDFFFGPHYTSWHSPYYWGYYPTYYTHRRPYTIDRYRHHIHTHVNIHNHYYYHDTYRGRHWDNHHHEYCRNDYWKRYPERSFDKRNEGYKNKEELYEGRRSVNPNAVKYHNIERAIRDVEDQKRKIETIDNGRRDNSPANRKTESKPYRSDAPKRTVIEPTQRQIESKERKVAEPTPRRSENVERNETKKVQSKPVTRERTAPAEVKNRSNASSGSESRNNQTRSKANVEKAASKVKTESVKREAEKSVKPKTEKKESNDRR